MKISPSRTFSLSLENVHFYQKRKFNGFILLILFTFTHAQLDLRHTKIGIVGGPNFSKVKNIHVDSEGRIAFYAGIFAEKPIGDVCKCNKLHLFLRPQVEYAQLGEKGKNGALYHNNYLNIPIFLKATYPLGRGLSNYIFQIGPKFSYLINQKVSNAYPAYNYGLDEMGKAKKNNFSISTAAGVSLNENLEILLRYDLGLSNIYPDYNLSSGKKSQHSISLGLSYALFEK